MGTAVAQWLRCCATNRKVAGSILDGVIGIFQPPTEMSTRRISWGLRRPVRKADKVITFLCRCNEVWEP